MCEQDRQKQHHRRPSVIRLPTLTELELDRYGKALGNRIETKPLTTLLKFSQGNLRVIRVNQGGGAFVNYDITVPRTLENRAGTADTCGFSILFHNSSGAATTPKCRVNTSPISGLYTHTSSHSKVRQPPLQHFVRPAQSRCHSPR